MNATKRKASFRKERRGERGQSTTEFALMLPVVFLGFFWIFEANVIMMQMHQGAYASYAAARSHIVERGAQYEQGIVDSILTGSIYRGGDFRGQSPRVRHHTKGFGLSQDGVIVEMDNVQSMPYARLFFEMAPVEPKVPTHLGPDEFNAMVNFPPYGLAGTRKMLTDNNIEDF